MALATNALLASGDEAAKSDYLPGIANGEIIATLALTEDSGRWDLEAVTLTASGGGGAGRSTVARCLSSTASPPG